MKSAPEPIWIGHLAPLSGPKQARGEAAAQAALPQILKVLGSEKREPAA